MSPSRKGGSNGGSRGGQSRPLNTKGKYEDQDYIRADGALGAQGGGQVITPGPWATERITPRIIRIGSDDKFIGEVYSGQLEGDANESEAESNARLITAAPDLLAACHAALEMGDDFEAEKLVRAAIAKAEGEQTKSDVAKDAAKIGPVLVARV